MPLEFAKLSSGQLLELSPERTVFFFPVGPIEDHGPHLPVGIDLLQALQLCFSAAQRVERELPGWQGVIMPGAPLGVEANTQKIAVKVRAHVLRDWLVDACRSLAKTGFRHFTCFSGHLGPKQLTAIEDASRIVSKMNIMRPKSRRISLISASSALVRARDLRHSFFFSNPKEHGGAEDTSWALFMKLVPRPESIPQLARQDASDSLIARGIRRAGGQVSGYWGDPSQASAEQGQQRLVEQLDLIFPKLRAVWEGGSSPNALFRSWYSILFFNKSFFHAWVIAFGILAMFVLWYWVAVMTH